MANQEIINLKKKYLKFKFKILIVVHLNGYSANILEILKFCKQNYDVSFPVTKKSKVVGKNKHEVYAWLTTKRLNGISESIVKWNFQKYLIDENGFLINHFNSNVSPTSDKILKYL